MVEAARKPAHSTLTIMKSRDFVVDRLLKPCEEDAHSKCTGWGVIKKEVSRVGANYFLKCTCACHHKQEHQIGRKKLLPKKKRATKKRHHKDKKRSRDKRTKHR